MKVISLNDTSLNDTIDTRVLANTLRSHALRMVHRSNCSHIGSCLSMADILAVLYRSILRVDPVRPQWPERDRLLVSKGHAAAIVYAALAERGFFPTQWLESYCQEGSPLIAHVNSHGVPGVELSTGSLGHALPVACGMALAGKRELSPYRVFVVLSDGELDEGSNWEAALFAPQHQLGNLVVIVDYNKIQSFGRVEDVLELHPLAEKWRAFRWRVNEIDGHDHDQLRKALVHSPTDAEQPTVILAHTIKGSGVSFMENQLAWHYKSPNSDELLLGLDECGGVV